MSKREPKRIVFVCVENARRSQMAEGFAQMLGREKVEVYSTGSRPSSQIDPLVIEVMKEKGIDLSTKRPKGLNDLPPIEMDYLIIMVAKKPVLPSRQKRSWSGKSQTLKENRSMSSGRSGI